MKEEIQMVRSILEKKKFRREYIDILLNFLQSNFENSSLDHITPNMIYNSFAYELGKHEAREIANYFEEFKQTGSYQTELEKLMDKWK